ncbi:MAG: YihA family ribosome biogenesis GTP-binding protein [Chryseobacterium sp.]|nr:MAG: YihA family ribosome biogenesis GTP-binding protein [Chryseobacterium sp.]
MVIHSADFIKSSGKWQECPEATLPEYAFIGRSNVGKSSLINAMMGRKNLAKTSQTPGKTQLINHFLVNENWYLTDLPGYGYAKVSKSNRKEFAKLITNYILNRQNLVNLFVLVDSRHAPQQIDLDFMQWCGESGIPFSLIFTKTDKLTAGKLQENIKHYQDVLLQNWEILPEMYFTSAEKRTGTENILDFIQATNEYLIKNKVKFL